MSECEETLWATGLDVRTTCVDSETQTKGAVLLLLFSLYYYARAAAGPDKSRCVAPDEASILIEVASITAAPSEPCINVNDHCQP